MTESEWLKADDDLQAVMELDLLWRKVSERKLSLFGAACCRRIRHACPEKLVWQALEVAEQYADGIASKAELEDAAGVMEHYRTSLPAAEQNSARTWAAAAVYICLTQREYRLAGEAASHSSMAASPTVGLARYSPTEEQAQCHLFRDIIGNPFRPVSIGPSWLTPTVLLLVTAAYEERILPSGELDAERLAVLSDALEEADCTDADILEHLRSPGPHVRGCWVVDLLTGRS